MELILSLVLAATASVVGPSGIELERLVDNSYDPPGIDGEFFIEVGPPVPCGDAVLFYGFTFDTPQFLGGYRATSTSVEVIANAATPLPGSAGTFGLVLEFGCVRDRIFFIGAEGFGPSSSGPSVYSYSQGVIAPFLEAGTTIDGNQITGVGEIDANAGSVAAVASLVPPSTTQALVVKPLDGEPFIVADRTVVLPGQTDPVAFFTEPVLVGSDLVFLALSHLNVGIYHWSAGQGISIVADTLSPVPAIGGAIFGSFDPSLASLDYGVVFGAGYSGGFGLFVWRNGQVEPLIVPGDTTEDGQTIAATAAPSGAGSLLTFRANTEEDPVVAIYVRTHDGRIRRILGFGDVIEGQTVSYIEAAADRESVAIRINRHSTPTDGTMDVIYRARFAEPNVIPALSTPGVVALIFGLTMFGLWLLSRSRPVLR
ncbi:MAG TPA: hypothetical protein VGG06_33840 [Thermoanaerobaculia bacterium]|jgi:hypothetical protein